MDFRVLGWITLALAVIASSPYWLRTLNSWTVKTKDKRFMNFLKRLRKIHKPLGGLLAVIALVHGYMALSGRIALHTGLLVYLGFFLAAGLGLWHHLKKNPKVFKAHKTVVLISFLLLALHLIKPWALGQWFGIW